MVKRTWSNREINNVLHRLGASYELSPERSAALEARVRREIISRYGSFAMPTHAPVHTSEGARGGMLTVFLQTLRSFSGGARPALVFAVLGVLVVGAVAVMRTIGVGGGGVETLPPSAVVASTSPVEPGSGVAVSVFGVAAPATGATTSPSAPAPAVRRAYRPTAQPITPAEGVFTKWGGSVFSEEELLKVQREGKTI